MTNAREVHVSNDCKTNLAALASALQLLHRVLLDYKQTDCMFVRMSRTNEERSVASRCNLIEAGRRLFGEHGYAATSTPMIAEAAGASRGALYHHFADKAALFAAVVEAEYERLEAEIERTSRETTDPLEALIEGGESFMTAASDPATQRILFIDGPAVVGIELLHSADS